MKIDKNYLKNIIKECFDEINKKINEGKKIIVKKVIWKNMPKLFLI